MNAMIQSRRLKYIRKDSVIEVMWAGSRKSTNFRKPPPRNPGTTAFALATAFTLLWPRPAALYFLGAAVIGASRVLSNAHFVSDVLVGAFVGTAATLYVRAIYHANGVTLADMLAGRAAWRSAPTWPARLALGAPREGAASCLPVRRPLP